jgi:SAM-dependent methyltransferase
VTEKLPPFQHPNGLSAVSPDEPHTPDAKGIRVPRVPVAHRDEEYNPAGFGTLLRMQESHFWYRGRHRFLLHALTAAVRSHHPGRSDLRAVDLGGGCGGWVRYLRKCAPGFFAELALADSSRVALELAAPVVGEETPRYQIDLLDLGWTARWDVAFLLDVLEHIPQDLEVLRQISGVLRPGGLLFIACPALRVFWSYNDVLAHHCRRYSRADFHRLGKAAGFEVLHTRYFQFFLSPLYLLSRAFGPAPTTLSPEQVRALTERTHRVPARPVNAALSAVFELETPLGWHCPFPWGTSVLGVFRRPRAGQQVTEPVPVGRDAPGHKNGPHEREGA